MTLSHIQDKRVTKVGGGLLSQVKLHFNDKLEELRREIIEKEGRMCEADFNKRIYSIKTAALLQLRTYHKFTWPGNENIELKLNQLCKDIEADFGV